MPASRQNLKKKPRTPARKRLINFSRFYETSLSLLFQTSRYICGWNTKQGRAKLLTLIAVLGSLGSASAILTVPEIRHILRLDEPKGNRATSDLIWKTHNVEGEFLLAYPNDWLLKDTVDTIDGEIIRLVPMGKSESEDIHITLSIQDFQDIPFSLREHEQQVELLIERYLLDSSISKRNDTILGGHPAREIRYVGSVEEVSTSFMQVFSFASDRLYTVTYSSPSISFTQHEDTAAKIISSFDIVQ